nr:retrotransposon protein, putative, unclassified [Tanacetum cinerariifolium]
MISADDFKSKFLPPMGIKGVAKVSRSWFLGCDLSLDCREYGEDNEQCRDTVHWLWVLEIGRKSPSVLTPMVKQAKLKLDLVGKPVDHTDYRSMIESLMYVISSRPDIMFATSESEYVTVSGCGAQVLWMRTQLTDYG